MGKSATGTVGPVARLLGPPVTSECPPHPHLWNPDPQGWAIGTQIHRLMLLGHVPGRLTPCADQTRHRPRSEPHCPRRPSAHRNPAPEATEPSGESDPKCVRWSSSPWEHQRVLRIKYLHKHDFNHTEGRVSEPGTSAGVASSPYLAPLAGERPSNWRLLGQQAVPSTATKQTSAKDRTRNRPYLPVVLALPQSRGPSPGQR